ncbi:MULTISPECIES: Hint domain-containing protein [Cobetia]|uniref:Hint domain-containing protein n=1 Tax=Cobetia TaxID=204286 RepID=UPI000984F1CF|nr:MULTISPECIES: Hint domain-containing protein [Cobetia]POR06116.1 hypothetical protein BOH68_12040 [Cobetia sp. MM1IDA2H-1]
MAVLNLNLAGTQTEVIDTPNDGVNITALGSSELVSDGVETNVLSIAGVELGAAPTFTATNGGQLNIDQGLLNVSALSNVTYNIDGASGISVDASSISALSGLSSYDVNFTGEGAGNFTYDASDVSLLDTTTLNVTGLGTGDTLSIAGDTWQLDDGVFTEAYRDGALHITNSGSGVLGEGDVVANIPMTEEEAQAYINDPSLLNGENGFTLVCFAEGTMIATPEGEVAVENLSIGDMIVTAEGNTVAVKWVGRQTVRPAKAQDKFQAIRFQENAIAPGLPNQDLTVTASHGMIIDGLVINAGALVNGSTITIVEASELPKEVTYYHIETENHEVILANGAATETYIDYVDRKAFENYDEYLSLYGMDTTITEMKRPRISARRLLPLAIRERFGIQEPQLSIQAA